MKDDENFEINSTGFMRLPQVLKKIPIGRSTWWLWVQRGIAPSPVKIAIRITVWRNADIRDLIIEMEKDEWIEKFSAKMKDKGMRLVNHT